MEHHYINIEIFRFINSHHHPIADAFFLGIRWLGTGYVLIPVLLFLYCYRRWKVPALLLAVSIETIVVHILKRIANQPRPILALPGEHIHWLQHLKKGSFPSGDAAVAFTVAFILALEERTAVRVALFAYGVLIAYERIYLGVHFPLDVAAGAAIGLLSGHLASFKLKRKWPKKVDGS